MKGSFLFRGGLRLQERKNLISVYVLQACPNWTCVMQSGIGLDSLQQFGFLLNYITNIPYSYEGWNFNSGNYLFTTDTKQIHVSKFYCPSM